MTLTRRLFCFLASAAAASAILALGCGEFVIYENVGETWDAPRTRVEDLGGVAGGGAALFDEQGLDSGAWLEVGAPQGGAPVGGYFQQPGGGSQPAGGGRTLLVVLPGASTFYPRGMVEKARDYHLNYLTEYHAAGYATWTLALPECGAPYATEDLAATRIALDWLLEGGGREALGVERVHLIGASAGGLIALRAALEFDVASVVDVSGLTRPDQLIERRYLYSVIASWFPDNTGLCQFADTLREYGPPDGDGWDNLDVVGRIGDLRSPLLAIHSTDDIIYEFSNFEALQAAIEALPADLRPPAEFYTRTGGHIDAFSDPAVTQRILEFLQARSGGKVGRWERGKVGKWERGKGSVGVPPARTSERRYSALGR